MNSLPSRILFVLTAPVSVPLFLLFLAYVNLAGLAYFLLGEVWARKLLGRAVQLPAIAFWMLSPLVIAAAAPALVIHLGVWFARGVIEGLIAAGRWQTGTHRAGPNLLAGAAWAALLIWCVTVSIDGVMAMRLVGREVPGSRDYSQSLRRRLRLGELPPAMQARREQLKQSFISGTNRTSQESNLYVEVLADDSLDFAFLPESLKLRMAGVPWYFIPAELSSDGSAHSRFLPGALLLTLLLLIRWPGMRPRSRRPAFGVISYIVRMTATGVMIWLTLSWAPSSLVRLPGGMSDGALNDLMPLSWLGFDPGDMLPPQWFTMNLAIGLVLLAAAVFIWRLAIRIQPVLGVPRFYSAFLAARLLQRKRIAFFSVGAVTLCVAMLLIVVSVMGGFVETIRNRATGLLGDLVMDGDLRGFPYYAEFIEELRARPDVQQATALIHSYGTLRFEKGDTFPVRIWGVTLDEYVQVNNFGRDLWYERRYPGTTVLTPIGQPEYGFDKETGAPVLPEPYESALKRWLETQPAETREEFARIPGGYFPGPGVYAVSDDEAGLPGITGKEYPGIIIGRDIFLRRLPSGEYQRSERFPRGCKCAVTMLPLSRTGQLLTESPPSPAFRYIDDSRTGIFEIDNKNVYVDFKVLQEKLAMTAAPRADGSGTAPPRCSQIQIKLKPGVNLDAAKARIDALWLEFIRRMPGDRDDQQMARNVRVSTWEELQADYIAAIQKEKVLVVIMFSVISLVAVFLVLCIFYMIVIEKTRDIGIIKSVGGSAEGVAAIFLTYGAAIGIVGSALGTLIGYHFVRHINDIQDWLARLNPSWRVWSPETYSFDKIPDVVQTSDMIQIGVAAVLASIIGAVVPAIRAARTWPVEALRYE